MASGVSRGKSTALMQAVFVVLLIHLLCMFCYCVEFGNDLGSHLTAWLRSCRDLATNLVLGAGMS